LVETIELFDRGGPARNQCIEGFEDAFEVDAVIPIICIGVDDRFDLGLDELGDLLVNVFTGHNLAAISVDHFTVAVHHVVVLHDVFASIKVVALDLGLGTLDRSRDQAMLDRLVFIHPQSIHQAADPVAAEATHQLVFQGHEEA
jgi:hypothetical protein